MEFHKGRATDAVFDSSLSTIQRLILLCYIKHANEEGIAWPGGARLARMCGTLLKSVKRHRSALFELQILKLIVGGDGSVYKVKICPEFIPTGVRESPGSESHQGQRVPSTGVRESPPPGSESPPNIHSEDYTIENYTYPHKSPTGDKPLKKIDKALELWDKLNETRLQYSPKKVRPMRLTASRRRQVNGRLRDYSAEEIQAAWVWWWTSPTDSAINLRTSWDIDTFLRPSRHDRYQDAAKSEADNGSMPFSYGPPTALSEEERERIEQEYQEELAERRRLAEEQKERDEAELRALIASPPPPAPVERLDQDREFCSWSEYQASLKAGT